MIDAPPAFDAIDARSLQEPLPIDTRKGRTLSQNPAAVRARLHRAQSKAGKPTRQRKATTRRSGPKSLAPEIGAFLALINGALIASPLGTRPIEAITNPDIDPRTIEGGRVGDELDAAEIAALSGALDAQCKRSPRFRRYVEGALSAGSGGTLITVVGIIAARRMARHGILPENIDLAGGIILSADVGALIDMQAASKPDVDPDTGEIAPDRDATEDATE